MNRDLSRLRILSVVTIGFLSVGIGPFSCENTDVNRANDLIVEQLKMPVQDVVEAQPKQELKSDAGVPTVEPTVMVEPEAVLVLNEVGLDQPEVYFAKGLSYSADQRWADAKNALDHAYALVAQAQAKAEAAGESGEDPDAQAHRSKLRGRIAFALGRVAVAQERFGDAIVEFGRALREDPHNEDARWNLELAWHMENPSCLKRDDNHEPDDRMTESKPYDPENGTDRLLCPNDEDWYSIETQNKGVGLFATIKGKVVQYDGDETRSPELVMVDGTTGDIVMTGKLDEDTLKVGQRNLSAAGIYHFALRGPGTGEFSYEVSIEEVPPCEKLDDDHEPDNSPPQAKPIDKGQNEKRVLCPDNQDWYQITGEQDMDLYIRVKGEVKQYTGLESRAVRLALFGPSSEVPLKLVEMSDNELRLGVQGLPEDGIYTFGLGGSGDGEFNYDMDIVVTPPCPVDDAREENDEAQQAYALKDETPPDAQGGAAMAPGQPGSDEGFKGRVMNLKACPDDPDYYTLTVPPETELKVSAVFDAKRAPLRFELIKETGERVEGKTSKEGKSISLSKASAETSYTFLVEPGSAKENNYFIQWEPPGEEGDDQQDQQDQQDQKDQQNEQQKPQPQGLSGDDLLDALDKQDRNPQLEKALRERRVIPDLEDY